MTVSDITRQNAAGAAQRTYRPPPPAVGDAFALDSLAGLAKGKEDSGSSSGLPAMDGLKVDMPNGFSVSMVHVGGGEAGFSAQMLASMKEMISFLDDFKPSDGDPAAAAANGNMRYIDTVVVPDGDGDALTLHYGTEPGGGNTDPAAAEAMIKAADAAISKYKLATTNRPPVIEPDIEGLFAALSASSSS